MKHLLFLILLLPTFIYSQVYFEEIENAGLPGVVEGSIDYGDLDNDGDIDVFIIGLERSDSNNLIAKIYRNNGNGIFSEDKNNIFEGVYQGDVALGHLNGDNRLDIMYIGIKDDGTSITKIYYSGITGYTDHYFDHQKIENLPFLSSGAIAFSDVDKDGDLDVFVTGWRPDLYGVPYNGSWAALYLKTDGEFIEANQLSFQTVYISDAIFYDYDKDGDEDLIYAGLVSQAGYPITSILRNDGSGNRITNFKHDSDIAQTTAFEGLFNANIKIADFNFDGLPDLLISGTNKDNVYKTNLYIHKFIENPFPEFNDLRSFFLSDNNFLGVRGDVDVSNVDGKYGEDILVTGFDNNNKINYKLYLQDGSSWVTNFDPNFIEYQCLPSIGSNGTTKMLADIDSDGDDDIILIASYESRVYRTILANNFTCPKTFITTWKTDNTGTSNNTSITIPTIGTGYNYDVDWDNDGIFENVGVSGNVTHNYNVPGTYTVAIRGDFPRIYFNGSGDKNKILSVEQWGDIAWTSMESAFQDCVNLVDNATDSPNLNSVSDMSSMFAGATSLNQDISNWDVSNITNMNGVFARASSFNQPLNSWDVSNVTTMSAMFYEATSFNQPLNNWNVGQVTDLSFMFYYTNFNEDIGPWNVGNVTNMSFMFWGASNFNQDIGGWNVSNVTTMRSMFKETDNFNQDIGSWDVSSVDIMWNMFQNASSFNTDLSGWNVGIVTQMGSMFSGATNFNQDLSSWSIENVTNMFNMFAGVQLSTENYDALLNSWSQQVLQTGVNFSGGNSQYCDGSAARQNIIDTYGWTITDGSLDPNCNSGSICPTGDVILTTQEDVDAFVAQYPNCTEIQGSLCLGDCGDGNRNDNPSNIMDISGLTSLNVIAGELNLYNLDSLSDYSGLSNLNSIGTSLSAVSNALQIDFSFLRNITGNLNGTILLLNNQNLISLNGLQGLTSISQGLYIDSNPSLVELIGIDNITTIGSIILQSNMSLISFDGFGTLQSLTEGGLQINTNQLIENLDGFTNLTSVSGRIAIESNSLLFDISGLQNVDPNSIVAEFYLLDDLSITNNSSLSQCSITNFCDVLNANDDRTIQVYENAEGCNSEAEIEAGCSDETSIDYEALVAFYNATNGDNWTNNTNWLSDEPLSSWNGITTKEINGSERVVSIELDANNLDGTLPAEIGELTYLQKLYLNGNKLNGEIPGSIGNLINIFEISMYLNNFSGLLPIEIGNLKNLRFFHISDNEKLTGNIPIALTTLPNLEFLVLGRCNFVGTIPEEFNNLSKLNFLGLNHNQLEGVLPNLSSTALDSQFGYFAINDNNFIFSDLEDQFDYLNTNVANFLYAPQNNFDEAQTLNLSNGQSHELTSKFVIFSTASPNNNYQWYKDDMALFGATSPSLIIEKFNKNDAGIYTLQVTNDVVTDLVLEREPYTLLWSSNSPKDTQFSVTPNPASDIVMLSSDSIELEGAVVVITNVKGTEVLRTTLNSGTGNYSINVGNLRSGFYLVTIQSSGSISSQQLIIR